MEKSALAAKKAKKVVKRITMQAPYREHFTNNLAKVSQNL